MPRPYLVSPKTGQLIFAIFPLFERLRKEDPVHYCAESCVEDVGAYWSITKYHDIMSVDTNHKVFSSEGAITLFDPQEDLEFIHRTSYKA